MVSRGLRALVTKRKKSRANNRPNIPNLDAPIVTGRGKQVGMARVPGHAVDVLCVRGVDRRKQRQRDVASADVDAEYPHCVVAASRGYEVARRRPGKM